jgi:hypothetical protein
VKEVHRGGAAPSVGDGVADGGVETDVDECETGARRDESGEKPWPGRGERREGGAGEEGDRAEGGDSAPATPVGKRAGDEDAAQVARRVDGEEDAGGSEGDTELVAEGGDGGAEDGDAQAEADEEPGPEGVKQAGV